MGVWFPFALVTYAAAGNRFHLRAPSANARAALQDAQHSLERLRTLHSLVSRADSLLLLEATRLRSLALNASLAYGRDRVSIDRAFPDQADIPPPTAEAVAVGKLFVEASLDGQRNRYKLDELARLIESAQERLLRTAIQIALLEERSRRLGRLRAHVSCRVARGEGRRPEHRYAELLDRWRRAARTSVVEETRRTQHVDALLEKCVRRAEDVYTRSELSRYKASRWRVAERRSGGQGQGSPAEEAGRVTPRPRIEQLRSLLKRAARQGWHWAGGCVQMAVEATYPAKEQVFFMSKLSLLTTITLGLWLASCDWTSRALAGSIFFHAAGGLRSMALGFDRWLTRHPTKSTLIAIVLMVRLLVEIIVALDEDQSLETPSGELQG